MGALSLALLPKEAPSRQQGGGHSDGGQYAAAAGAPETAPGASAPRATQGLGATGAVTTAAGGYPNVPTVTTDTHRQAASRYRG
jgi:hypothetical protein